MSEADIEKDIQAKGLNAPRLTPEHIDATIVSETFTILPSGKCMVCELILRNGFSVRGEASVVSKANFNEDVGRKVSRGKARDQIWLIEGYLLQERLAIGTMGNEQIKHMVDRFLGWKLPDNFSPDGGISFKKTFNEHTAHPAKHEPSGTNLFDATQADAMVRYMIDGTPSN